MKSSAGYAVAADLNRYNVLSCLAGRYVYNKYGGSTAYGRGDFVETAYGPDGSAIGNRAESDWLWIVPWGFRSMLNWVNSRHAHLVCSHWLM